jgi:hypothetical protein
VGIAEWIYGVVSRESGWVFVFLAACGGVVALMLLIPWHAFRAFRRPLEDRDRWIGIRRHGKRWAARRATRDTVGGRHRTPEGGRSTWEYIDSGAWAVISTGQAVVEEPLAGQETTVLSGRRLTPSDTEEGQHGQGQRALGATAA